jgi:hypothetical protein
MSTTVFYNHVFSYETMYKIKCTWLYVIRYEHFRLLIAYFYLIQKQTYPHLISKTLTINLHGGKS